VRRQTQMKRDGRLNSIEKGEREGYFNYISKKCNYVYIIYLKFSRVGNKSPSG
jgi:hypothetical protein